MRFFPLRMAQIKYPHILNKPYLGPNHKCHFNICKIKVQLFLYKTYMSCSQNGPTWIYISIQTNHIWGENHKWHFNICKVNVQLVLYKTYELFSEWPNLNISMQTNHIWGENHKWHFTICKVNVQLSSAAVAHSLLTALSHCLHNIVDRLWPLI